MTSRIHGVFRVLPMALLALPSVVVLSAEPSRAGSGGFGCDSPVISVETIPTELAEGDAGSTPVDFAIGVDQVDDACLVEIAYQTQDGTATDGDDYQRVAPATAHHCGIGDLAVGSVNVFGDALPEEDETFDVVVTSFESTCSETCGCVFVEGTGGAAANGTGGGVGSTVTILNDDQASVSVDDVQVEEGNAGTTNLVFTVRAEPLLPSSILVGFETVDGTATVGDDDYQPQEGSVTIEAEAPYEATVTVPVIGDVRREENETFRVRLTGVEGEATIGDGEGVGTILNDEGEPSVSIDDVEVVEGDAGQSAAVFAITVSPLSRDVRVDFATEDGTATAADADYAPTSGSLLFSFEGPPTQTVSVPVRGDTRVEADETFRVVLTAVDGGEVSKGEGVGTVVSDDVTSLVRIAAAQPALEGAGAAPVVVERVSPSGDPARVTVNARAGTATAGVDFQPITAVVSWGPNEGGSRTVQIPLLDDDAAEGDETIRVTLTAPLFRSG